ncbi:MAG: DUF433 domain-containing protein [Fimbriimonadaceae bacterium]
MRIPQGLEGVLSLDAELMHGELCFVGTRVPLGVLLDNLQDGMSVDDFLIHYPSVLSSQVDAVLAWEHRQLRVAAGLDKAG